MTPQVLAAGVRLPTEGPHLLLADVAAGADPEVLPPGPSHHLIDVLRARPGDPVSLTDGAGRLWQAALRGGDGRSAVIAVRAAWSVTPPTPAVRVVQGLPKGRKMDEIVRRVTELGVDRISPVTTTRGESRPPASKVAKLSERWTAIAAAAVEQCRRAWVPAIDPLVALSQIAPGEGVVLWEEADVPLRRVLADIAATAEELVIVVGPEGGLTAAEVAAIGLPSASLGPTVLRTETAAVAGASLTLHMVGRLG